MQGDQGRKLPFSFFPLLSFYDSVLPRITTSTALLMAEIEAKWVLGLLNIISLNKSWILSFLYPFPLLM